MGMNVWKNIWKFSICQINNDDIIWKLSLTVKIGHWTSPKLWVFFLLFLYISSDLYYHTVLKIDLPRVPNFLFIITWKKRQIIDNSQVNPKETPRPLPPTKTYQPPTIPSFKRLPKNNQFWGHSRKYWSESDEFSVWEHLKQ